MSCLGYSSTVLSQLVPSYSKQSALHSPCLSPRNIPVSIRRCSKHYHNAHLPLREGEHIEHQGHAVDNNFSPVLQGLRLDLRVLVGGGPVSVSVAHILLYYHIEIVAVVERRYCRVNRLQPRPGCLDSEAHRALK